MSHFCTIAVVPNGTENVEKAVEELLAPYDENIQVEPYDRECSCIGWKAFNEARQRVNEEIGTLDELERPAYRKDVEAKCIELVGADEWAKMNAEYGRHEEAWETKDKAEKALDVSWEDRIAQRSALEEKYQKEHSLFQKPDPECRECSGTGTRESSYNPVSKWDWWQIGGRWNSALNPDYDPRQDPENQEECDVCGGTGMRNDSLGKEEREKDPTYTCNGCMGKGTRLKWPTQWRDAGGNVEAIKNMPEDFVPYALVTPDGEWHEKGEMGWWGISSNEKEDEVWESFCKEIFEKYKETHLAVIVDCHI